MQRTEAVKAGVLTVLNADAEIILSEGWRLMHDASPAVILHICVRDDSERPGRRQVDAIGCAVWRGKLRLQVGKVWEQRLVGRPYQHFALHLAQHLCTRRCVTQTGCVEYQCLRPVCSPTGAVSQADGVKKRSADSKRI